MEYLQQILSASHAALAASPLPWDRTVVLLHVLAEAGAALAAVLLPVGLLYLAARRDDLEYRGLLVLLSMALLATAIAHGVAGLGLWSPDPLRSGIANAAAATLMLMGSLAFWKWLPRARRLPSSNQLRRVNANLSRETFEQQQELRAIRARAELYTQLFAQAEAALALVAPAGVWSDANPRFLAVLGRSRATLPPPDKLLGKDYAKSQGMCTLERAGSDSQAQLRLQWQVLAVDDRHLGWLVQCNDVTAECRNETALEDLRKDLEARMTTHQRELSEASTRLEQEMGIRRQAVAQVQTLAEQLMRSNARLNQIDQRIGTLARRDPATGMATRYAFADRMSSTLAESRRYGTPVSLLLLTPDPVEGLSPAAALVAAAKAIHGRLRETDVAGVLDEQHLAVLLPHTPPQHALDVAERFRRAVVESSTNKSPRLTCCIGVASWSGKQGEEDLVRKAADALRRARATGRNRVASSTVAEAAR